MTKHRHFIIHKPYGYLSQFVTNQRKQRKKKLLADLYDFPEGVMAIGRLDEPSEGLLLITTDGKLSEQVRGRKVEKEYYVQVDGEITPEAVAALQNGVEISIAGKKYETLPCKVRMLKKDPEISERPKRIRSDRHGPTSWIVITITEGKFRQIRKMTAAVGFPALRLIRIRIGDIKLDKMPPGGVDEVQELAIRKED